MVALSTLALLAFGCDSTTGIMTDTYTDPQFGFSFEYTMAWEIDDSPAGEYSDASVSVGAFDPDGAGIDDYGLDQVVVDVYEIADGEEVTLEDLKADFQGWLDSAAQDDASFTVVEPVSDTTVGGLQGCKATITYTLQDIPMRSTEYWLLGDGLVYNLYTDSSEDNWAGNQGIMEKFITTFTP